MNKILNAAGSGPWKAEPAGDGFFRVISEDQQWVCTANEANAKAIAFALNKFQGHPQPAHLGNHDPLLSVYETC